MKRGEIGCSDDYSAGKVPTLLALAAEIGRGICD